MNVLAAARSYYKARTSNREAFQSSTFNEGIRMVTMGGAILHNGERIEPPVFNMTSREFSDVINNVTSEEIARQGGFANVNVSQYTEVLQNSILISVGPGLYNVKVKTVRADGTGNRETFISKRDPNVGNNLSRSPNLRRFILDLNNLGLQN